MPEVVIPFVDADEPKECYVVPIKFTATTDRPDDIVAAVRRAVVMWRDEDRDGKLPEGYFNPGDLLDWCGDPNLELRLRGQGIAKVEPGLTGSAIAWNFDEFRVTNDTQLPMSEAS